MYYSQCFHKLFLISVFLLPSFVWGQVSGKVSDAADGQVLQGVTLQWEGTTSGTVTDGKGFFSLVRNAKHHRLLVRYAGYRADTVIVHSDTSLELRLHALSTNLKKVSVRGRRKASFSKMSSLQQTEVITTEGLRGLACCNLGESFENSATVDVGYADAVSGSRQIQMLGLTGVYSLMLLENVPFLRGLSNPFGLGYVPGQWMEGISVSKGVATVKNGYEAITGTINLEYEKPLKGDRFTLNLYENSDLKSELTAKLNHRINEHLATGLYLFGTYDTRRTDHIGHDGFADYPLQRQFNILNRWDYEGHGGFHSQSLVNYTHEKRLGGEMNFEESMRGSDSIYGFGGTTNRLFFSTKNGIPLNSTSSFGSQVSASWFRQEAYYGLSNYSGEEGDLYVNLLVNAEVSGGHIVDYGVSLRYRHVDNLLHLLPTDTSQLAIFNYKHNEMIPGVFGQYTFRYGDDFNATAGLRYDYNSFHRRHLLTPRLHFRWHIGNQLVLRGVAGRGFRTPDYIAENIGLLASGRRFKANSPLALEEAWNAGANLTKKWKLADERELTVAIDYYHTRFVSQTVVDLDQSAYEVLFYGLDGKSYSNVLQADINIEPFDGFSVSAAGKLNDVWCTYNGTLMRKPYTSFWKALMVLSYHTRFEKWRFDLTTQLNGPQRLPLNKGEMQGDAPAYLYMLGQVTRRFKHFELYAGVENITGHVQQHPIIGADAPFSQAFDASVIYAPLMGRLFYIGFRMNVL